TRPVPTTLPAPTQTAPATTPTTSTTPPPSAAAPPPPPPPTSTTSTAPTAPAGSTTECGNVAGGFIKNLRAGGVPCSLARATARAWFAKVQEGADPSQQITAGAFACTGALHGERAAVRCRPTEGEGGSVT